jgi:CheY-specific phosphatase CheX
MPEALNYQDLARRYGLEPIPESVTQLTKIVARQDASIEEVAQIIAQDAALKKRVLRTANPMARSEADYEVETVEEALMRNGLGCALLLAMSTPLSQALLRTFQTMLGVKLQSVESHAAFALEGQHILGTIGFSGRAAGSVYLRLSTETAQVLGCRILGTDPGEHLDVATVNDTVGELLNIITGNFKSNLCDAGLNCRLQPPQVSRTAEFALPRTAGVSLERMAFRADHLVLFVDLRVNPWNDD